MWVLVPCSVILTGIITVLLTVVFSSPALSRLPVKMTEHGTKTHLWHDMFTYWTYTRDNAGHEKTAVNKTFYYTCSFVITLLKYKRKTENNHLNPVITQTRPCNILQWGLDSAVVSALACHRCDPGSNPAVRMWQGSGRPSQGRWFSPGSPVSSTTYYHRTPTAAPSRTR